MNLTIFSELWLKMRHEPLFVFQYYDEGNELDEQGNKSIQYIVEFEETRTVAFAVSAHRALKACWTNMNKAAASLREKRALTSWNQACVHFLATDFYA